MLTSDDIHVAILHPHFVEVSKFADHYIVSVFDAEKTERLGGRFTSTAGYVMQSDSGWHYRISLESVWMIESYKTRKAAVAALLAYLERNIQS